MKNAYILNTYIRQLKMQNSLLGVLDLETVSTFLKGCKKVWLMHQLELAMPKNAQKLFDIAENYVVAKEAFKIMFPTGKHKPPLLLIFFYVSFVVLSFEDLEAGSERRGQGHG